MIKIPQLKCAPLQFYASSGTVLKRGKYGLTSQKFEEAELDMDLMDFGAFNSNGKSRNVWGNVPFPTELIKYAQDFVEKYNRRPSVWTSYDDVLYSCDENGKWSVHPENLPQRISATFKCSRKRFTPISENMAMRIAAIFDLPTSYNYIVKFTPEKHKEITDHINPVGTEQEPLFEYGIISVDMLKGISNNDLKTDNISSAEISNSKDISIENSGDQLISILDSEQMMRNGVVSSFTDDGLVENWMKSIEQFSSKYLSDVSEDEKLFTIAKINSRIARSTLFRTFVGDCDFTAYNCGCVYNPQTKIFDYAPNFDYGEAFTSLRISKLEGFHYNEKTLQFILAHQPNYLEMKKFEKSKSVKELAQSYESAASEENLRFLCTHFKKDIMEFMTNLNRAVEDNSISDIVYSYTDENKYGKKLISKKEADMFDEYLTERANWISFVIIKNILEAEPEKFMSEIIKHKLGRDVGYSFEKLNAFVNKKYDSVSEEYKDEFDKNDTITKKYEFLKNNYPEEIKHYVNNIDNVVNSFWRKSLSENFIDYFDYSKEKTIITKDDVKEEFLKSFVDKVYGTSFKTKNAPIKSLSRTSEKSKA